MTDLFGWTREMQSVADAGREFVDIMGNDEKRDARVGTIGLDDMSGAEAVIVIKPVERFIEDEEVRTLHESAGEQAEALFTAG